MALSGTSKIIAGVTCAGITGGAGIGTYYHLNSAKETTKVDVDESITVEKIEQKLSKVGYQVLKTEGTDDDTDWDKILEAYNKIQQKDEIFSISKIGQKETKENLKSECKKAIDLASSKNFNYSLAKRWCVKPETINEMLKRNKYAKLDSSNEGENKAKWKEKISLIRDKEQAKRDMNLNLQSNDGDASLLEAACVTLKIDTAKTHDDKEFEKNYTLAKDWCSLKGA